MKLLMTASSWEHIQNFHIPYLREFHRLGWETHVGCAYGPSSHIDIDRLVEMPFRKNMSSRENLQALNTLRKYARAEHYDLIITHTTLAAFFTRLAVKGMRHRPPLVDVMHGYLFDDNSPLIKRWIYLEAERFLAPETDLLLTMNDWDFELAKEYRLGKRIEKIPGIGVDFTKLDLALKMNPEALRKRHNIPQDAFALVYAAEFSARKSQPVIIQAMRDLPENVVLLLCGDGITKETCIRQAESLGVKERIYFPGYINDMGTWYRMADAAVCSSRSEGLPFNVIEAMYMGLPVVASKVKGHTDLITDGKTGLLYPYGDAKACADCVRELLIDKSWNKELLKREKATLKEYDLQTVQHRVMKLYCSLG